MTKQCLEERLLTPSAIGSRLHREAFRERSMTVGQFEELDARQADRSAAAAVPAGAAPPLPLAGGGLKTRIHSIDALRGLVMFLMLAEAMHLMNVRRAFPGNAFWEFVAFNTTHV